MGQKKIYDKEYKVQAVKLGREVGFSKAAEELGIPTDTIYGWNKAAKAGPADWTPASELMRTGDWSSVSPEILPRLKDRR